MPDKKTKLLHIKNMVCPRCITVVRQSLEEMGLTVREVELGKAMIENGGDVSNKKINHALQKHGFALILQKDQELIEQIKTQLIQYAQHLEDYDEVPKVSDYLSEKLHQNYASLSSTFSKSENITIEKYLIHLKIERVKELVSYDELTLSEIAWKIKYSSVAHLSNQFKKITGMSVTDYKKAHDSFRKPLDGI